MYSLGDDNKLCVWDTRVGSLIKKFKKIKGIFKMGRKEGRKEGRIEEK